MPKLVITEEEWDIIERALRDYEPGYNRTVRGAREASEIERRTSRELADRIRVRMVP